MDESFSTRNFISSIFSKNYPKNPPKTENYINNLHLPTPQERKNKSVPEVNPMNTPNNNQRCLNPKIESVGVSLGWSTLDELSLSVGLLCGQIEIK